MSEERLDQALEAMKNERATEEEIASARGRVWAKLMASAAGCEAFQPKLNEYLEGRLIESRRLLMEDHLSRCPGCRQRLAVLKGERMVGSNAEFEPHPPEKRSWRLPMDWARWRTWALAACLVLVAVYLARHRIDSLLAPSGPRAVVEAVSGSLYRLPEGALKPGTPLGEGELVRTGPASRTVLRLADGSAVEVNERSELYVTRAWSGETIHLHSGDIIVQAAKQHRGTLRVLTRDSVAAVKGTVFGVSTGVTGSVVSVLEGSVQVSQPGTERLLRAGEQAASSPVLQQVSFQDAVSWSPDSERYLALLASFVTIEKQMAKVPQPAMRTESSLLPYLPPNARVFGTMPNLTGTIGQALSLADQQANESAVFKQWWSSSSGQQIRDILERVRGVTPLFGEEIAFVLGESSAGRSIPFLMAEVQPGKREAVVKALEALPVGGNSKLAYRVTDRLVVLSESAADVDWALHYAGLGASGAFATDIARRYQRGVSWLVAVDFASLSQGDARRPDGQRREAMATILPLNHLFFEQRSGHGEDENSVTLTFRGARTGIASWLASTGTSGAAEYISGDAVFAFSASTREPSQVFDEFCAQVSKIDVDFPAQLEQLESKLGIRIADDVARALGTDFAVAIEQPSVPVPGWIAAVSVNSPQTLDHTIGRLVEVFNEQLGADKQAHRLALTQGTVNGRLWNTLKTDTPLTEISWTYDGGYLVAGSSRALVTAAIATRNGGFPLIWSASFQQQLPASAGLHPSGFGWLNAHGALQGLAALGSNTAVEKMAFEDAPILVVLAGEPEQIRAVSRTRLTSLVLDAMMAGAASQRRGKANDPR